MSSDTLITSAHRRGKRRIASREHVDSKRCRMHSSREATVNPRARSRRDENNKRDENCVEEQCQAPSSHRETPETTQAGMLNNFIEPLRKIFGRRNTGLSYAEDSPASAAGDSDKEPPLTGPSGCTSSKDGSVTSEGESNREESIKDVLQQAATEAPLEEIERVSTDQGPSTSSREEEGVEDDEDENAEFDPFYFMKHLPPLSECVPRYRQSILPPRTRRCKRKTLVLDLDETLVHSSLEHMQDCHFTFPVFFNNNQHTVFVRQRPHLHHFMQQVAALYEVVVFTASQAIYAEKLLNILDPARKLIRHRIYRDSCVYVDGTYLKDLSVLGRELGNTVIVDNSPQAFGFQVENGIPIESWYDDTSDQELLHLLPFLQHLADVEDVRPYIVRGFGIHELIARA